MRVFFCIAGLAILMCFAVAGSSYGQALATVKSDAEVKAGVDKALREAEANAIPTDSFFEARRCQVYNQAILSDFRNSGSSDSEEAQRVSSHLDVWNAKVRLLAADNENIALSDDFVLEHSALGFLLVSPESGKESAQELFKAEFKRCRTMVSAFYTNLMDEIIGKNK